MKHVFAAVHESAARSRLSGMSAVAVSIGEADVRGHRKKWRYDPDWNSGSQE
jgi:hypothetical protein